MAFSDLLRETHCDKRLLPVTCTDVLFMDGTTRLSYLNELSVDMAKTKPSPVHPILASFSNTPIADECPIPFEVRAGFRYCDDRWIGCCMLDLNENNAIMALFYESEGMLNALVPNAPLHFLYAQLGQASSVLSHMERHIYGSEAMKVQDARAHHEQIPAHLRRDCKERTVVRPLASVAHHMSVITRQAYLQGLSFESATGALKAGNVIFSTQPIERQRLNQSLSTLDDIAWSSMHMLVSSFCAVPIQRVVRAIPSAARELPKWPFESIIDCTAYVETTPNDEPALLIVHDNVTKGFQYAKYENDLLNFDMTLRTLTYSPPRIVLVTDSQDTRRFFYERPDFKRPRLYGNGSSCELTSTPTLTPTLTSTPGSLSGTMSIADKLRHAASRS